MTDFFGSVWNIELMNATLSQFASTSVPVKEISIVGQRGS